MNYLKRILKFVLPTPALKQGFLLYNSLKIRTVDRILYSTARIKQSEFISHDNASPFIDVDLSDVDKSIRDPMSTWVNWKQEQFIVFWDRPCIIEPTYGWAITHTNSLIYESLSFSRTDHQRKPSLLDYWGRKNSRQIDKVISIRDTGEENYFHFYNDVLCKLFWLRQTGIDITSLPILIAQKLWSKAYFQGYLKYSQLLSSLQWIIQDGEYVECKGAFFVKAPTHNLSLWKAIFREVPIIQADVPLRIFISRKRSRLRFIKNDSEIERICDRYGFAIIDNDELSYDDQIRLYSSAAIIIGIHGSGLTNLYFRNGQCKVLEIFPSLSSGYLPFHYIMLAKMKGFTYDAVVGDEVAGDFSGGFFLSPLEFEQAIKRILS